MNHNISRVIKNARTGDNANWVAALAMRRINGTGTLYLAQEMSCSHDKVENYRYAGDLYVFLLKYSPDDSYRNALRAARRKLRISHFVKVARLFKKYEYSPDQALMYLVWAALGKKSVSKLDYRIKIENEPVPDTFYERPLKMTVKWAEELRNSYQVPEPLYQLATDFVKGYERWRDEHE